MEVNPSANNLEKLKAGILFRSIKKENEEPQNSVLGQVSKELKYLQRQHEYVMEVERVLKELRLTVFLIESCKTAECPTGVTKQDLIASYQGNFLTLVHQMKDKICQLVHMMTEKTIPAKVSIEKDISIQELLRKKDRILRDLGIEADLKEWNQDHAMSKIAIALRKRRHHHHLVSGLRYDKDFVNLGFADVATNPAFQAKLTDYGKEQIAKLRLESTERLFSGALRKTNETLEMIEQNVEKIARALSSNFSFPTSSEEMVDIIKQHSEMLQSFEVVNRCSIEKIPELEKKLLDDLLIKIRQQHSDKVVAIYVVGSLARGEFEEEFSDINMYIILNVDETPGQMFKEEFMFSLRVFTQKYFLSEDCRKFRVIAKADGVLLYGTDLTKDEQLPKAGLMLALTLNDDIIEHFDEAKKWIEENEGAAPRDIARKSRRLAKRLIDFMYGVAMANKPQYTASRGERLERIQEQFPDNEEVTETLFSISRYGVGDLESFTNIIDGARPRALMNLERMEESKSQIEKSKKVSAE